MIKKTNEIKKAIELRRSGKSLGAIALELGVAKSSVSVWVRNIILDDKQISILKNNALNSTLEILLAQAKKNKDKYQILRNEYIDKGYNLASNDEYFRIICSLYWAEGSKNRNHLQFCNSDMNMLRLFCGWVNKNVVKNITFYIKYYGENGLSEYQIKRRWIKCLPFLKDKKWSIKLLKLEIRKDSQKRGVGKLPYGTITVVVSSTQLIQSIYGGIKYIQENIGN